MQAQHFLYKSVRQRILRFFKLCGDAIQALLFRCSYTSLTFRYVVVTFESVATHIHLHLYLAVSLHVPFAFVINSIFGDQWKCGTALAGPAESGVPPLSVMVYLFQLLRVCRAGGSWPLFYCTSYVILYYTIGCNNQ